MGIGDFTPRRNQSLINRLYDIVNDCFGDSLEDVNQPRDASVRTLWGCKPSSHFHDRLLYWRLLRENRLHLHVGLWQLPSFAKAVTKISGRGVASFFRTCCCAMEYNNIPRGQPWVTPSLPRTYGFIASRAILMWRCDTDYMRVLLCFPFKWYAYGYE